MSRYFFDTNILVYALGSDEKAVIARELIDAGGRIGVQCLNELANVALNKLKLSWAEIDHLLARIRHELGRPVPLDDELHVDGCRISRQYKLSVYDGMIVAAALTAGCDTLYSEDMHAGLVVDGRLTIVNPFA